jgi:hypothetical protein
VALERICFVIASLVERRDAGRSDVWDGRWRAETIPARVRQQRNLRMAAQALSHFFYTMSITIVTISSLCKFITDFFPNFSCIYNPSYC